MAQKTCFVVMGFGIKTDFATGRKLDLDKSYRLLIKPVVEDKGLVCVRADEIRHSGSIEARMYQELLTADMVIADLSTANPNALYELGIRHALRPRTTIVISENKLTYPFDLNHVVITSYTHLGDAIDFEEVMRFREVLGNTIIEVLDKQNTDSPVYTFLQQLTPPFLEEKITAAVIKAEEALKQAGDAIKDAAPTPAVSTGQDQTLSMLVQQGEEAIRDSDFITARAFFRRALKVCNKAGVNGIIPQDHYLVQRLVLATYKAEEPNPVSALNEALTLLEPLNPKESNDPETVGLAGAIEKRLFEQEQGDDHLNRSIRYHERGYLLRDDWYNGINLAYLLNLRAASSIYQINEEKLADMVWANRVRREMITLCQQNLDRIQDQLDRAKKRSDELDTSAGVEVEKLTNDHFWCLATKAEAHYGLGEMEAYKEARSALDTFKPAEWMVKSFETQINKLRNLLDKQRNLIVTFLDGIARQKTWTFYPPRGPEASLNEALANLVNEILFYENPTNNSEAIKNEFVGNLKNWLDSEDPNLIYFSSEIIGYFKDGFAVCLADLKFHYHKLSVTQTWKPYQLNCLWAYCRLTSYDEMNLFLLKTSNTENQRWILEAYEQMAISYKNEKTIARGDNPALFLPTIDKLDNSRLSEDSKKVIENIKKLAT